MRSKLKGRYFLLVISLSALLGLACSRRSGPASGDANNPTARNPVAGAAEPMDDDGSGYEKEVPAGSERFASAPAGDAHETVPEAPTSIGGHEGRANSNGGTAPPVAPARKSAAASSPVPAELSARNDSAYTAKSRQRETMQPREERPGLGTSWGETRKSWVSTVSFERDNEYTPTATQRIFYNDAHGVLAQTDHRTLAALGRNRTEFSNGFVTVELVGPDGDPLPGVISGGRSYVVGRDGESYAIRLRNNERYRVEVVATVDGLDVIDGTKGTFQKRGYVVDPYSSLVIEGFRKSTSSVASFRFGAVSDSYAARTGSDRNVGVIGIALFAERGCCAEPYTQHEIYKRESAQPFPGQYARPPQPAPRRQLWAE